jgi:formate-dependent nitrite reductase cytochrome c552 subunit
MMSTIRRLAAIAVALAFAATAPVPANQDMAVKENLKCAVCHDKAGSKLLTSKGKFYEFKGTLAGYDDLVRQHKKCTSCHSKEPGNLKLTAKGEALKAKGTTMHDVCAAAKPKS